MDHTSARTDISLAAVLHCGPIDKRQRRGGEEDSRQRKSTQVDGASGERDELRRVGRSNYLRQFAVGGDLEQSVENDGCTRLQQQLRINRELAGEAQDNDVIGMLLKSAIVSLLYPTQGADRTRIDGQIRAIQSIDDGIGVRVV